MNFALTYAMGRAGYRVWEFFRHWYMDAPRAFFHWLFSFLEDLDRTFAIRVTFEHFFEPLYRDYTAVGRILGVVFRTGRIFVGGAVYAASIVLFGAAFLLWLLIPLSILVYAFGLIS